MCGNQHRSRAQKVYERNARLYDIAESPMEFAAFNRWRKLLFSHVSSERFLEIGVGTGKNIHYYPGESRPVAIDFSGNMLARAKRTAAQAGRNVDLELMDVEHLAFPDQSFDTVVATFVFCSVPDPIRGLREVRRVCKPTGRVILLEHVRPSGPLLGRIFDLLNPLAVRLSGANINRRTVENAREAELHVTMEQNLFSDIVKLIIAQP